MLRKPGGLFPKRAVSLGALFVFNFCLTAVAAAISGNGSAIEKPKLVPLYRLWNEKERDHMMASSSAEKDALQNKPEWNYEGIDGYIYESQQPDTVALFRYRNKATQNHYISSDQSFQQGAGRAGFDDEGILGYLYKTQYPGTVPLYQFYSEIRQDYFVTTDQNFLEYAQQFGGYNYKRIEGYVFKMPDIPVNKVKPARIELIAAFEGGRRYRINKIDVLDLRGTYRQMGRQYGMLMKNELKDFYQLAVEKHIFKRESFNYEEVRGISADLFETYPQRFKEILYGMSETSGLDAYKLIILDQILAISYVNSAYDNMGCSAIAVWGDYTSGGPLVFGRNFDYIDYFRNFGEYITVAVYTPSDGSIPTATIGYAGQICVMNAINKAGLFLENNEAMISGGNTFYPNRTHFFILEFAALLNSYDMISLSSYLNACRSGCSLIVNVADKNGAYSYEAPPFDTRRVRTIYPGLMIATNHFNNPSWGILEPLHDTPDFSVLRKKNLLVLAEKYRGRFNPKKMMEILDIPIQKGGAGLPGYTMYQLVVEPQELRFWLKVFRFQDWVEIDLKNFFGPQ